MRTYNYDNLVDLMSNIIWQYGTAENLQKILALKTAWYNTNHTGFWDNWYRDVFNLETANDFGLSVWGRILDFKRQINLTDGTVYTLTTEQYRLLLKGRLLLFRSHGTVSEINTWLKLVFGKQGRAYVLDNLDMTTTFVFEFQPTEEQQFLLNNVDFLPHPAGVGYNIRLVPNIFFGFAGSGMRPFNQGVFYIDFGRTSNYIIRNGQLIWANPSVYLQSTGRQYINTGYVSPDLSLFYAEIDLDFAPQRLEWIFGERGDRTVNNKFIIGGEGGVLYYQMGNVDTNIPYVPGRHLYFAGRGKYGLDDKVIQTPMTFSATTRAMCLLYASISGADNPTTGKLYSCKMYQDDQLVRHFVPVPAGLKIGDYTVPSNGAWDIVEQKFYGNAGGGEFNYGKDEQIS